MAGRENLTTLALSIFLLAGVSSPAAAQPQCD